MASLVSLNAIHPDLTYHVREDRPSNIADCEVDEQSVEDIMVGDEQVERRLQAMNKEDTNYLMKLETGTQYGQDISSESGQGEQWIAGSNMIRTDSPVSIRSFTARPMNRTVTINEPIRSLVEKGSPSSPSGPDTLLSSYPRRDPQSRRTISMFRTNTMNSLSSFSTFLSDSWEKRHDSSNKGFWATSWQWLVGGKSDEETGPREGDPDYIPPKYRWTPILSGLLQPFSILLEIPGLTEHWYVRTENNHPVAYKANPAILDVGLAISMACAVVANIALISRFLERRVLPSTIVTIIGLSIHDLINITAVTIFGIIHRFDDGFSYSEAFWLCEFSV